MSRRLDAHVFYVDNRTANAGGIMVLDAVKQAEKVVVAAYVVHGGARQTMVDGKTVTSYGLRGTSGVLLQKILDAAPEKTSVIALGSPISSRTSTNSKLHVYLRHGHYVGDQCRKSAVR